mmetsp:Transcript_15452/g.19482  ORF Transcript_15452/g.19482 Transcript_15452/m.19482 type:complete len:81 (+) Transcript_15452:194-436(+)
MTGTLDLRPDEGTKFELGPLPPQNNKDISYMTIAEKMMLDSQRDRKNFVEFNRGCVRENSLRMRIGSSAGMSRLPRMRIN